MSVSIPNELVTASSQRFDLVEYSADDVDAVFALEHSASKAPWTKKNIQSSIDAGHICLALKEGPTWVAHAVFTHTLDEFEILILSVSPDYKRKGIARSFLLAVFKAFASVINHVLLEVRKSNKPAKMLYRELGFDEVGRRKDYYPSLKPEGGYEDAIVMRLELDESELY